MALECLSFGLHIFVCKSLVILQQKQQFRFNDVCKREKCFETGAFFFLPDLNSQNISASDRIPEATIQFWFS